MAGHRDDFQAVSSAGGRAIGGGGVVREIAIRGEMIRLGQLLKLAGLVGSGAEGKLLLAGGRVSVNGEPEIRRGRQLNPGDVVAAEDELLRVTGADA
ncbi:MAG: ribosome-associated protein [Solirubrobacteraceae bacterium]|nr:ribosome-associated protein [Solirubrobacteraceae bacterium]